MEILRSKGIIIPSFILGFSLILSSLFISRSLVEIRKQDNVLTVVGSTRTRVISDQVKWRGEFFRRVLDKELKIGYTQMSKDKEEVMKFLKENGINEKEITISPVFMEQVYNENTSQPREYILRQTVEINSEEVDKISNIAQSVQKLIDKGVLFSTVSLEYYYSKLPQLRIDLLGNAVEDAKIRAEKIASATGKKIKSVKSASMGVVQVLSPNSVEISDYGTYDVSTVEKEVMVTVKVSFIVE